MPSCEENAEPEEHDPSELVCGGCSGSALATTCPKHGAEFIEFKCQFCCHVACWFCWGKTHFCDACHKRQVAGDYLSRKPKSAFPVCPGRASCPLKVDHPHVEEFSLGCSICRKATEF